MDLLVENGDEFEMHVSQEICGHVRAYIIPCVTDTRELGLGSVEERRLQEIHYPIIFIESLLNIYCFSMLPLRSKNYEASETVPTVECLCSHEKRHKSNELTIMDSNSPGTGLGFIY
jgi:hypothetical protein